MTRIWCDPLTVRVRRTEGSEWEVISTHDLQSEAQGAYEGAPLGPPAGYYMVGLFGRSGDVIAFHRALVNPVSPRERERNRIWNNVRTASRRFDRAPLDEVRATLGHPPEDDE